MAPIVVSHILRVHGSSGHEPNRKNLQNKQGTRGGVLVGSPMLKLVKEIESKFCRCIFSHTHFSVLPLLFMKKDLGPLSMGSGCLVFEMEGRPVRLSRFNHFSFWVSKTSKSSASKIG